MKRFKAGIVGCGNYGNGVKGYWGTSHARQIGNYYECLAKGVKPQITGSDAVKIQKMICAIYESGKTRKRVIF